MLKPQELIRLTTKVHSAITLTPLVVYSKGARSDHINVVHACI